MRILAINGSPRGDEGVTAQLLEQFSAGAADAGATVETVVLAREKIHHCTGEFHCWLTDPGKCIWDGKDGDTMEGIRGQIAATENLVLATPVYVDSMTGLMKNMFDRVIPNALPFMELDEQGDVRHPMRVGKPTERVVLISTCGFPEMATFGPLVHHVKRIARNFHGELVGSLLRPNGMVLPVLKDWKSKIFSALRRAGTEFVRNGRVDPATEAEVSEEYMSKEVFVQGATAYWEKAIEKGSLRL
jgi:multimeric flavodoxin WrbA